MLPQIANWDKFFLTPVAFFSCQMMRHKNLVPRAGQSPLVQTTKHCASSSYASSHCLLGRMLHYIGCTLRCDTQIVGCQLAGGREGGRDLLVEATKHNWLPRSPAHLRQSHSRLQQIRKSIQQIQNHRTEKYFCAKEMICFQQIENPGGEKLSSVE